VLGVHPGDQLVELKGEQPAVGAELDDVSLDLGADAPHHLESLEGGGDVPDGGEVLDLERGQAAGDLVEPQFVPLERRQGLIGAGQDVAGVLEQVTGVADVHGDDVHRRRHRDHREGRLPGHPLCGAVAGAGLVAGDGRVGHEVDRRTEDAGGIAVDDDAAVHLGELP